MKVGIDVHVDSGSAIISGDVSTNPNAFVSSNDRRPEGYVNRNELDTELFLEGTEFSYVITYGSSLTLFVRSASTASDETPLVISVTENGHSKVYTVSGFQGIRVLHPRSYGRASYGAYVRQDACVGFW